MNLSLQLEFRITCAKQTHSNKILRDSNVYSSPSHLHHHVFLLQTLVEIGPAYFMNCRRETVNMGLPPGNRRGFLRLVQDRRIPGVLEQYVAGGEDRKRPEGGLWIADLRLHKTE